MKLQSQKEKTENFNDKGGKRGKERGAKGLPAKDGTPNAAKSNS